MTALSGTLWEWGTIIPRFNQMFPVYASLIVVEAAQRDSPRYRDVSECVMIGQWIREVALMLGRSFEARRSAIVAIYFI